MFKRFYGTRKLDADTHTDTTMQLSLSMKVWVVPKHSINIYAEITDFCVGEQNRNQSWKKELLVTEDSSEF